MGGVCDNSGVDSREDTEDSDTVRRVGVRGVIAMVALKKKRIRTRFDEAWMYSSQITCDELYSSPKIRTPTSGVEGRPMPTPAFSL